MWFQRCRTKYVITPRARGLLNVTERICCISGSRGRFSSPPSLPRDGQSDSKGSSSGSLKGRDAQGRCDCNRYSTKPRARDTRLRTDGTAPGAQESNGSGGGSTKPSAATQALKPSERTKIVNPNFQILLQLAVTSEAAGCLCTPRTLYFIKRNLLQHFGQELQEIINKFLTSKGSF